MSNPETSTGQLAPGGIDSDYAWLKTHLNLVGSIDTRRKLVDKVKKSLVQHIESGRLPYTLGIFGGWGTGKTTLLAMLAQELENVKNCKVVYFNSWKYAGFMEIVPALIYKILQYGLAGTTVKPDEAARRVLLALGKKYSDQVGEWAKTKMGIDPVRLFKDLYDVPKIIKRSAARVPPEVIGAYYTQVDKAQDEAAAGARHRDPRTGAEHGDHGFDRRARPVRPGRGIHRH